MSDQIDHFPLEEFRCKDGTPYPAEWEHTRLPDLKRLLERIRLAAGEHPVTVLCGYRTVEYNQKLRDRGLQGESHITGVALHSQHTEGRAADVTVFGMDPRVLHGIVMQQWEQGHLPELGGIGKYERLGFVHVDTWKLASGELRRWNG